MIPIGRPKRAWTRLDEPTRGGPAPFEQPLLASTHVPADCLCSWAWHGPAKALARKYVNGNCPSRHRDTWVVPW